MSKCNIVLFLGEGLPGRKLESNYNQDKSELSKIKHFFCLSDDYIYIEVLEYTRVTINKYHMVRYKEVVRCSVYHMYTSSLVLGKPLIFVRRYTRR